MKKISAQWACRHGLSSVSAAAVDIFDDYENNLNGMDLQRQLNIQQKPIERKHSIERIGPFEVFSLLGRVDSFNFEEVKNALLDVAGKSPQAMAVNLENAEFLSIPFIKLLSQIADGLKAQGHRLALVSPTEKIKRQIDIFASLDDMVIYRSRKQLED